MFAPVELPKRIDAPSLGEILEKLSEYRKQGSPGDEAFYAHDHMVITGTKPEVMGNMSVIYTGTKIAETDGPYLDHSGVGDAIDDRLFDECAANAKFIAYCFQYFETLREYVQLLQLATAELRAQRNRIIHERLTGDDYDHVTKQLDEGLAAKLASAQVRGLSKIKYNAERNAAWA